MAVNELMVPPKNARLIQAEVKSKSLGRNGRLAGQSEVWASGGIAWIKLSQEQWAVIDELDFPLVSGRSWHVHRCKRTCYAITNQPLGKGKKTTLKLHRAILGVNDEQIIDHRDGNGLHNRRQNIRTCTYRENAYNRAVHCSNKIGLKGVSWEVKSGKWKAQIMTDGRKRHLGHFETPEMASFAYREAARLSHGEFIRDERDVRMAQIQANMQHVSANLPRPQ